MNPKVLNDIWNINIMLINKITPDEKLRCELASVFAESRDSIKKKHGKYVSDKYGKHLD